MNHPYQLSPWNLDELFPGQDSPEMEQALQELESRVAEFEALRPHLSPGLSVKEFLEIVRSYEAIVDLIYRLGSFSRLRFNADTQDQIVQAFMGRINQLLAVTQNRLLFFELWWKDLPDAAAGRLMSSSGDYRYWLEEMRHFKPHTLSEAEEKIINIKDVTGVQALNELYSSLTNRYVFKLTVDGEEKLLTRGQLMVYVRGSDPALRALAYQEMYRVYGEDGTILSQIYQSLVRDWRSENMELRGYTSPIATRNLVNDIPDAVVDTLLEVARRNATIFQRYFRLKARWLGVEKLRRYDIYAPLAKSDRRYSFDQAAHTVLDSFDAFTPLAARLAQRVFDENHLDSEVRKGKRDGAFCATVTPDLTPYVLVNYQGRADDVATLAHELGHAIHAMLAEHHSLFTQHSSLPLAETASTFAEMLLVDRLLADETDEAVRRDLLFRQLDDAYATIMRQSYFALFERQAHELIHQGATTDELSAAYMENLRQQFGDSLVIGEEFRWEWVSIPHIYNVPFYVYAYAFGQLLVLSLYQQYKQEGEAFKPRYLEILAAGGSASPESILNQAGIDMRDPAFWQGGFDVLDRLVAQLEALPVP
jgi:oligoendopeptidase F